MSRMLLVADAMPHRFRILRPAVVALVAVVLVGCPDAQPPADQPLTGQPQDEQADWRMYLPEVVTEVTIRVEGCTPPTSELVIDIDPVAAHVEHGTEFSWTIEGSPPARVEIRSKDGPWPFQQRQFGPIDVRPGQRLVGGPATEAQPGETARYAIHVRCGNQSVIIDPDIVIRSEDGW